MDRPMVRTPLILVLLCACPEAAPVPDAGPLVVTDGGFTPGVDGGTPAQDSGLTRPDTFPSCEACAQTACTTESDCDDGETCLDTGRCTPGECWQHSDCEPTQRCFQHRCVDRPEGPVGVLF